jgi:hypothetical protein
MKIDCKVHIDTSALKGRMQAFESRLYPAIKTQIYKGAYPFTPYVTGTLAESAFPSSVDSTQYLVYNCVYARRQYYADGLAPADFPGRSKATHPLATCLWVDEYLKQGGKQDIQTICDNAPTLLRF